MKKHNHAKTDTKNTKGAGGGGKQGRKGQGGKQGAVVGSGAKGGAGKVANEEAQERQRAAIVAGINAGRAENGKEMVSLVPDHDDNGAEENLIDALSNLMHYARSIRLNFENALRMARMHFEEENREAIVNNTTKNYERKK